MKYLAVNPKTLTLKPGFALFPLLKILIMVIPSFPAGTGQGSPAAVFYLANNYFNPLIIRITYNFCGGVIVALAVID